MSSVLASFTPQCKVLYKNVTLCSIHMSLRQAYHPVDLMVTQHDPQELDDYFPNTEVYTHLANAFRRMRYNILATFQCVYPLRLNASQQHVSQTHLDAPDMSF
jgi:hypothetical protein